MYMTMYSEKTALQFGQEGRQALLFGVALNNSFTNREHQRNVHAFKLNSFDVYTSMSTTSFNY